MLFLGGIEDCDGLVDPMCGSGTFLFEGYMILNRIAPNLNREFSFQHWLDYDADLHEEQKRLLQAKQKDSGVPLIGCEIDPETHRIAGRIAKEHFPEANLEIHCGAFQEFECRVENGLLMTNPPYGQRMGVDEELISLYKDVGYAAKRMVPGGKMALFTINRKAAKQIRLKADHAQTLFNGALEGLLYEYSLKKLP
jgi:putative N6-adenine-specific DNA methylase